MPRLKWGPQLPLWAARTIKGEDRRVLTKFLLGIFPIPRKGVIVPREAVRELAELTKKSTRWSK